MKKIKNTVADVQCSGSPDNSTNHSSSQKTRLNDLSYGIKTWTDLSLTDGETDRWTEFSSLDCICIPCSVVKLLMKLKINMANHLGSIHVRLANYNIYVGPYRRY